MSNKYIFRRIQFALFIFLLSIASLARADYVGEVQTTKYLDQASINMISARYQAGLGGLVAGDEISYIIQFTPSDNGGQVGAGAYVTDYIPAGTEVVNAQFVRINGDGSTVQIAPPGVSAVLAGYVPMYSETGIFYSTDPRTAYYSTPLGAAISPTNGYAVPGVATTPVTTTHNFWDKQMVATYVAAARVATRACTIALPAALGAGPVTGPDSYLKNDYTGSQGPWHRISYPGSMYGTATGVAGPLGGCIGGVATSAGWPLSSNNPLPSNVTAVRFAGGSATVGELFSVRITLRLTQALPSTGLINNSEVFGGDSSISAGAIVGKDNMWKYHGPSAASANTTLTVIKRVVGMCVGVGCTPTAYTGGAVPAAANLKLRYEMLYLNSSGSVQTNVLLSDALLPTGASLVAGSAVVLNGPNILPTTGGPTGSFMFAPIASLGSGAGGSVQFDVNFAAAPAANVALSNTAKLTSFSLPAGVQSVATVTPTTLANLNTNKTTSTPQVTPGGVANYTMTIANNGLAAATAVTANDYLPSAGGATVNDRFSYLAGATATLTTSLGVVTPLTVTVTPAPPVIVPAGATGVDAAYIGLNREKVVFTFAGAGYTGIPSGGYITLNFSATVGSNVPQRAAPYLNDLTVSYTGGFAGAVSQSNGVAPVTVIVPMSLTKSIDCVYSGASCVPYTNGNISTGSKLRYRLSYANTGLVTQSNVVLTDNLPPKTTFVAGTATEVGTPNGIVPPVVTGLPATGELLTFPAIASFAAGAAGAVTFDVQLDAAASLPSGSYITNNALLTSTAYSGGVTASVTSSVLDQAQLVMTKATSTPVIAVNGTATYTITVTNTGGVAATGIKIYDWLPFTGAVANANTRFNFTAGSTVFALQNPGASTLLAAPAPVVTMASANVAPNLIAPYSSDLNQTQVLWTFTPAQTLAPGASFTLTFTAAAGAAGGIPAGSAIHTNDAQAVYLSGANTLYSAVLNTAPVTIPTNLSVVKTIDCVYNAAQTACNTYSGGGIVPVGAKVRYKIHYQNNALTAQTNVYLCDQISSSTGVLTAALTSPVTLAPTPAGVFANTAAPDGPPTAVLSNPANALCVIPALAGSTTFSYPVIPSLAAGAGGDVYYDVLTNITTGATLTNMGKIVSAEAPSGETSVVAAIALAVPVLAVTKTTINPTRSPGDSAQYTITVTNNGSAATTNLRVYDFLPYISGGDATTRFGYASTGAIGAPAGCTTPTVTSSVPPSVMPYSSNLNQQQVKWDFAGCALAAGASITITFNATVGSAMPIGIYGNSVQADFDSVAGSGSTTVNQLAQITIASGVVVSGRVYSDANHNGSPEASENWTGGPAVYVKLATLSGGVCVSPALSVQTISAPAGTYSFSGVAAGQYCIVLSANNTPADVAASIPAGWRNSMPASGILQQTVAAWDVTNQNFGVYSGSSLAGRVFLDNGAGAFANNGVQDSGEAGINGVTVTANQAGCASTLCATAITDGNGDYVMWLPSSVTGAITVTEVNLSGYLSTGGQAGNTGGAYVRSTDTTAFSVVPGTNYSGVNFADVPDNQFLTDGVQSAMPGSVVFYPHTFIAGTSGAVSFAISNLSSPAIAGWNEIIYVDANCNAVIDTGEIVLTAAVALTAGQTVCLLVKEFIPAAAPINAQNALTLTATFDATFSGSAVIFNYLRHDTTTAGQATASGLALVKSVSTASALPGTDITYTVAYTNKSGGLLSSVIIYDATPFYTLFQSASCGVLPQNLSACVITAPAVNATGSIVYTMAGTLAPGSSGEVSFVVRVQP